MSIGKEEKRLQTYHLTTNSKFCKHCLFQCSTSIYNSIQSVWCTYEEILLTKCTIRSGDPIPRIEYNEAELSTWKAVFDKVEDLLPGRACLTHRKYLELMKKECNFSPDNIPQLEDLSNFLKSINPHCYCRVKWLSTCLFHQERLGSPCGLLLAWSLPFSS